ncbi:conserved hypothetical protein [Neospora caninum Liverpool]|uniref:Peptidase M76 family protein n=1 Tax=Neospora caninum (strain Liverpool) TaxID=572307 RepID=F0VHK2_NEOCL|nr:conserved hypothetical protein [Neospora caninum Liverpool]CBZ53196.1 conserved hypothetical protein [Neospora caninum Liverpool]|eukprot:XP_003883228.1 conserved hypothetical protein [Neospora caninum Liverpool]
MKQKRGHGREIEDTESSASSRSVVQDEYLASQRKASGFPGLTYSSASPAPERLLGPSPSPGTCAASEVLSRSPSHAKSLHAQHTAQPRAVAASERSSGASSDPVSCPSSDSLREEPAVVNPARGSPDAKAEAGSASHLSPQPPSADVRSRPPSTPGNGEPASPLLKFGDETLSWIQRQQMKLWSFFALRDWRVKTLVHALSAMGAPVDLIVVDCAQTSARATASSPPHRGGYSPVYHTVWLCGNCFWSPFELRRVLLHELVHAFDFARAEISPDNCRHVACTEIRAYNLSGQCSWWATKRWDEDQFQRIDPALLRPRGGASTRTGARQMLPEETSKGEGLYGGPAWENGPTRPEPAQAAAQSGEDRRDNEEGGEWRTSAPESRAGARTSPFFSGDGPLPWQDTKRNRCLVHNALNSLRDHQQCKAPGLAEVAITDVFQRCLRDTWPFMAPPERDSKWRPSRIWRDGSSDFFKK